MNSIPIWIWYLVGAVLVLVLLILVGWIALFLKAYPERKRNFDRMKREFDEDRDRIRSEIRRDRREMNL